MGNCLITKLKSSVNNDNLPLYNTVKLNAVQVATLQENANRLRIQAPGKTIKVSGDGYFALTNAGLDNPSLRLTSYVLGNEETYLYFKNDTYSIFIEGRYGGIETLTLSAGSTKNNVISMNIDDLKYNDNLVKLDLLLLNNSCYGNAASVAKSGLTAIGIYKNPNITGSILDFVNCTSITSLSGGMGFTMVDLVDFVQGQIAAGRSTCNNLTMYGVGSYAYFGNINITAYAAFYTLSWTSASHIVLIGTSGLASDRVYAKGATAEEIAQWEAGGKTVFIVE